MVGHQQNRGTVSARIGQSKRIHSPVVVLPHNRTHLFPIAPESPALRKYSCAEATCRITPVADMGSPSECPESPSLELHGSGWIVGYRDSYIPTELCLKETRSSNLPLIFSPAR